MNDAVSSLGPLTDAERRAPHVYARDVTSGAGDCVCKAALGDPRHTAAAPGVPVPEVAQMIAKAVEEPQRFVLGIAYVAGKNPQIKRGVDGGRDFFTKSELEKACWSYMSSGRPQMNAFHVEGTEDCAVPVESFIWRWPDWDVGDGIVVKDGDWCLGAILSPDMWALHKAGKINGLSPEGTARRRRVAKEGTVTVAKGSVIADEDDDELTELVDARFRKVAVVGQGANGVPRFLISKEADESGLLPADYIRDLIAKTAPEEALVPASAEAEERLLPNGITLKGSAADIAAFIHAASDRPVPAPADVAKAKYSAEERRQMASSGQAMDGGEYPIKDADDLGKAIHAVGRGGDSHDAIRKHVIQRAKALGKSGEIPDNWNSDGSLKGDVSKEADVPVTEPVAKDIMDAAGDGVPIDDGLDGMDPTTPFAAPADEPELPGDPTDPGSPAWEGIDAATAHKWLAIAARLKNALLLLAERESLEAASADPGDIENAFSLEDAACAVDYAIGNLAVFASGEKAEAEIGAEAAEMCKALAGVDAGQLDALEGLSAVRKAGRVLSSANEGRIRDACKSLQDVLSSLPAAPAAPDQPVAKETEGVMPATTTETPAEPVAKEQSAEERKAQEQARDSHPVDAGGGDGSGEPGGARPHPAASLQVPDPGGDIPGKRVVKASRLPVVVYDRAGRQCVTSPDAILDPVAKADGDGDGTGKVTMQAVFDADGNLVGIVDPADITPVAGAGSGSGGDAEPAPAAPADDDTPQPPADAGTPADAVGKAAGEAGENVVTVTQDVLKSIAQDAAREALEAQGAAHQEAVAKMAADGDALREELRVLKERLVTVENSPAPPGVFAHGAVPPKDARPLPAPGQLRGQDQGGTVTDAAKAAVLKKKLYGGTALEQNAAFGEMQQMAIERLAAMRAGQ